MPRRVPYQIRLIAYHTNPNGTRCIYDMVETSFRCAPRFARQFMRNDEISSFVACAPDTTSGREWRRSC
jgi:hypothetical protein